MKTIAKSKFRTKYEHRDVGISFDGVRGMTDPQYLNDCNLENIIRKYGVLSRPVATPLNVDVSDVGDFADALKRVQSGLDEFSRVPSDIRSRFGNDPVAFYKFVTAPENGAELVRLGLAHERKVEKPDVVDVLVDIKDKLSPATPAAGAQ